MAVSPAAIKIDGLAELRRTIRGMPKEVRVAFSKEMASIADEVVTEVKAKVPVKSGAARNSVKRSFSGGYVAIRAGGDKVPYYPWLDFGGTLGARGRFRSQNRPFIKEGRYIYPTIAAIRPKIVAKGHEVVEMWKRRAGL